MARNHCCFNLIIPSWVNTVGRRYLLPGNFYNWLGLDQLELHALSLSQSLLSSKFQFCTFGNAWRQSGMSQVRLGSGILCMEDGDAAKNILQCTSQSPTINSCPDPNAIVLNMGNPAVAQTVENWQIQPGTHVCPWNVTRGSSNKKCIRKGFQRTMGVTLPEEGGMLSRQATSRDVC